MKKKPNKINIPTPEEYVEYLQDYLHKSGEKAYSLGLRALNDSGVITRYINESVPVNPGLVNMRKIQDAMEIRLKSLKGENDTSST